MLFLYSKEAGAKTLKVDGEEHKYLFKVRRLKLGETLSLRDLKTPVDYKYKIIDIDKKSATLSLVDAKSIDEDFGDLHIAWCMCEPKIVEKTLPSLNELGVKKISFIYCSRSQKNFKLNLERVEKILINSSQQCGRALLLETQIYSGLEEFLSEHHDVVVIDFSDEILGRDVDKNSFIIGPEGGFSDEDREIFKKHNLKSYRLKTNTLRSQTATIAIASILSTR